MINTKWMILQLRGSFGFKLVEKLKELKSFLRLENPKRFPFGGDRG